MEYKLEGQEELIRNFQRLNGDMAGVLETAARAGALIVQNGGKEKAPFLTGTLRRSIHMETVEKSEERAVVEIGTYTS